MIGITVFRLLSENAGVRALVGTRIYPAVLPQDAQLPAITYTVVDDMPAPSLGGWTSKLHNARVQVDGWAKGYIAAATLAEAVTGALSAINEPTVRSALISRREMYEDEVGEYGMSQDFSMWLTES